jgi:hypothetical protein
MNSATGLLGRMYPGSLKTDSIADSLQHYLGPQHIPATRFSTEELPIHKISSPMTSPCVHHHQLLTAAVAPACFQSGLLRDG